MCQYCFLYDFVRFIIGEESFLPGFVRLMNDGQLNSVVVFCSFTII